ncbi:hypothetical protein PTKU46_34290 [Paraburkholderia terrae]|uniref:DUF3592 domain-containing protein n=1 Tax=Paraburkholderia terrae TaxID=311230 RepID=UPI0030E4F372
MKRPRNLFALAIGLCFSIGAAFCMYSAIEFRSTSIVTMGKVIHLNSGGHHPQIAFNAADGQHYERPAGTLESYAVGQAVAIRYSPGDPAGSAIIDSALDLWAPSIFLLILAVAFLDAGLRGETLRKGLRC